MLARTMSLLAYSALLLGCTDDGGLAPDAVGGDELTQDDDAKADGASGLYDYFTIRPADGVGNDGLWFVTRINRESMRCPDGVMRAYCTIPTVRVADGLDDPSVGVELGAFDRRDRGYSSPWGAYYAPDLVRGEMAADALVITEIWRPGRFQQPSGVWVELSDLHAPDTHCADASWATSCESRLNSAVAWPISVANLLDVPYELQDSERTTLLDPARRTIIVGTRGYLDGLPIREMTNIYLRTTSR